MSRPRTFDKDKTLEKILRLVWAHGSSGLSLDDIARQLKLSKTSLYSAFGNKNALLSQCLELYESQYEQPMLASFNGESITDCIRSFLNYSSQRFASPDSPPGCFMFNCSIEGESLNDEFRLKVEQNNIAFKAVIKARVIALTAEQVTDPGYIDNVVDLLMVNLFGLASASRMKYPLSGSYLTLLDQLIEEKLSE